jgi:hypothetical protein
MSKSREREQRVNEMEDALCATADADSTWREWATELVDMGFGNLRDYRAKLISLYLKGDTAALLQFIMEEV